MITISKVASRIEPSLTRKLFNKAKEYDDVIDFTLGDPDVPTPNGIKEAGCKAIMDGKTRYSQNAGLKELRDTIHSYYLQKEGLDYCADNEMIVTVGAMEGLYLALLAILDDGDEVLIPAPYYVNYRQMVGMCHATPVIVEDEKDGSLCGIQAIKAAITSKTKAIILNTPCNPTGRVMPMSLIEEIAKLAVEHNLVVIADEVYKCLIYGDEKFRSIVHIDGMRERTILVNSLSKEFCMTGWRLGYVLAPQEVVASMIKLQENICACAPLPSQYAAIEALQIDKKYSSEMVSVFGKRKEAIVEELQKINGITFIEPEATFYILVDISKTGLRSEQFAYALLDAVHVAVVPGVTYGKMCDRYVRIAFTLKEAKIREGIRRMKTFVDNLNITH